MVVLKLPFGITLHYSAFAETSILNSDNAVKSQFSKLNYQNLIIDVKSYFNSRVGPGYMLISNSDTDSECPLNSGSDLRESDGSHNNLFPLYVVVLP